MEKSENHQSNSSTSGETAGEKFLRELKEMPYDTSRVGQAYVMLSPRQNSELSNLSEKELNTRTRNEAIEKIMIRSGKTREEVELMLADPF